MTRKVPDRGDIVWLDFNPTKGHEQQGSRPAMVVSPRDFNRQTGLCWVAPITNTMRGFAFEVLVSGIGKKITGVVITHQIRSIDYKARTIRFVDNATADELHAVMERVQAIVA
jgi:mRNA interferase MazF